MAIDRLSELDPRLLYNKGIKLVILDLDNTISPYGSFEVEEKLRLWIKSTIMLGIDVVVVSNTWYLRALISRIIVQVPVYYMAFKPFPFALWKIIMEYGYSPEEVCVVGDQVFTDILMARIVGSSYVYVKPLSSKDGPHTRIFRLLEKSFLAKVILRRCNRSLDVL